MQLSHPCLGLTPLRGQQPSLRASNIITATRECCQSLLFKGSLSVTCFLFKDRCGSQRNCFHIKRFVGRLQCILVEGFLHSRNRDGQPCKAESQAEDFSFNEVHCPRINTVPGSEELISITFPSLLRSSMENYFKSSSL